MKIAVVMPSYLGIYKGAATKREEKFLRAVKSFKDQDYENKILVIVSDGCKKTEYLYQKVKDENIHLVKLPKQKTFSGSVRQAGVRFASKISDVICYLDTDDYLEPAHLKNIAGMFERNNVDWIWFNDILSGFGVRISIMERSKIGTSNIAHKSHVNIIWSGGYCHDWRAIESMKNYSNRKVNFATYNVCHIPNQLDV